MPFIAHAQTSAVTTSGAASPASYDFGAKYMFAVPGTYDPGSPDAVTVSRAIREMHIGWLGGPQDTQIDVLVIMLGEGSASGEAMWATRYRFNQKGGNQPGPVFDTLVYTSGGAIDAVSPIPMPNVMWTPLMYQADRISADWGRAGAGRVTAGAIAAALLFSLLGMLPNFFSVPLPQRQVPIPGQLPGPPPAPGPPGIPGVYDGDVKARTLQWQQVNGRWVLGGRPGGTGIPRSLFDADPSLLGDRAARFVAPVADTTDLVSRITDNARGDFVDQLSRERWKDLNDGQRMVVLQQVGRDVAEQMGVDPDSIKIRGAYEMDGRGVWKPGAREVWVNARCREWDSSYGIVRTLTHEIRHAAQTDKALGAGAGYQKLVDSSLSDYVRGSKDFARYAGQIVERDANVVGRDIARALFMKAQGGGR